MKYKKKPVTIEATQWFRNGDHPEDKCEGIQPEEGEKDYIFTLTEGKVVRRYRHPNVPGNDYCNYCQCFFHDHGWIDTLEGGHIVCPGDFVITGIKGEKYPCKPEIFEQTYEKVQE